MAKSPAPSPQILGHYVLRKKLGAGAMGQVWLAHDKLLDRQVAIKVLHAGMSNKRLIQDFIREAQAAAKLNHPNTVTIYQIDKQGGQVFIAMEYVEAGSLSDELRNKGALPWREATQAIRDAAAGLQAAHERGMVHRDIKPSNLMRSTRGLVKVVDFGLAKARTNDAEATQTQAGTIMGSPAYMSPEQCRGERADARSDLYSLICSYYHLLTRQTPFAASEMTAAMYQHCHEPFPDVRATGIKIPNGVCRILEKGSLKNRDYRYQTAAELIADLDTVLHTPEASHVFERKTEVGKQSRAAEASAAVAPRRKGTRIKVGAAAGAGLIVAVVAVIMMGHRNRSNNETALNSVTDSSGVPVPNVNGGRDINLLPLVNPEQGAVAGTWRLVGGVLTVDRLPAAHISLKLPYAPADDEEYDLHLRFSYRTGTGTSAYVLLSHAGKRFNLRLGQDGSYGLENVLGSDAKHNVTGGQSPDRSAVGVPHDVLILVRRQSIEVRLDGKPIIQRQTDYSEMDESEHFKRPYKALGLGSWQGGVDFETIDAKEISGRGTVGEASPSSNGVAPSELTDTASRTDATAHPVVDLMPLIGPKRDSVDGDWRLDAGTLSTSAAGDWTRLQIPFTPPEEYEWTVVAERTEEKGHGGLLLGFVMGENQSALVLDGFNRTASGLETLDGAAANNNSTTYRQRVLPVHQPVTIVLKVLKEHVTASYDGKTFIDWKGSGRQLNVFHSWTVPNTKQLFIGAQTPIHITSMTVRNLGVGPPSAQPSGRTDGTGHRIIDLIPFIDPKADALRGSWTMVGGKLRDDHNQKTLLRLPYLPSDTEEYDFHVGFVLRKRGEVVHGLASYAGYRFSVVADSAYGLENVGGKDGDAYHNSTTHNSTEHFARDVQHDFVIRVRASQVDVCLDGRRIINYSGGYDKLSENENWKRPDGALGIGAGWGDVDYGPLEVIEVKGSGTLLRGPLTMQSAATPPPTGEDPHRQTAGLVRALTTIGTLTSAQVAPGGRRLCFSTKNISPNETSTIDLETGARIQSGRDGVFTQLLPDGKRCVGDGAGKWRIWNVETGKDLFILGEFTFGNGAVSADGTRLLTFPVGNVHNTILYDLDTGAKIRELKDYAAHHPYALSLLGKTFAAEAADQLHVWDTEKGNELWHAQTDRHAGQLVFSVDGKRLLRRSRDKGMAIGLYNAKTGELLAQCGGWSGQCNDAALRGDGRFLVAGCDDLANGLRLFKLGGDDKKLTATVMDWPAGAKDIGPVNSVAFSDDNRRVLVGCRNGKVRLYDVGQGIALAEFDHGGEVLQVSYAVDNRYAVSGNDTTIRVWRLP